jgi:hypothetical protein
MVVNQTGVFAANHGSGTNVPAFTAKVDYVFDTANSIIPEDGWVRDDDLPPFIQQVNFVTHAGLSVLWATDELSYGYLEYGLTSAFEMGVTQDTGPGYLHNIDITDLIPGETYFFRIVADDGNGNIGYSSQYQAFIEETGGLESAIWYGLSQTFGGLGVPQQAINILGNIATPENIGQLTFALNGGPEQPLSIGPFRRLEEPGDFNIEINFADLIHGINDVDLFVQDLVGNVSVQRIVVNYPNADVWPINYSVDWNASTNIQDVAQIVDGLWKIDNNHLRPAKTGYDRAVAIGDVLWTDYEVLIPITIHGMNTKGFEGINGKPAVGVMLKWPGHSDWTGDQPAWGYYPGGGGAWYEFNTDGRAKLYLTDFQSISGSDPLNRWFLFDTAYIVKIRVETQNDGSSKYSLKTWETSQSEPVAWELVAIDTNDVSGGSLLFVAHYVDVSFGRVEITPVQE